MDKLNDMEAMAEMSIDQIEAMVLEESAEKKPEEPAKEGEQVVEDAATGEDTHSGVEMKGGKGIIPYAVLKETREELAEVKRKLESLQAKPYQAEVPVNHAEMITAAQTSMAELNEKFENGDIEWEEYQKQLLEVSAQRENLLAIRIKTEISNEMKAEAEQRKQMEMQQAWSDTVSTFLVSKPDGIDYNSDPAKYAELDAAVKMFANNPANASRDNQWFLSKAHKEVMENNGLKPVAKPPAKQKEVVVDDEEGAPIYSLSDIAGGSTPAGSDVEQIMQLSGSALTNRFLNDPKQIDKLLDSLR